MSVSASDNRLEPRFDPQALAAPADVDRLQRWGLTAMAIGGAGLILGFTLSRDYFFRAYLVGWVYCVGITFGCLALAMLHHLTGGAWGLMVRRLLEAATRTLPLLLALALPLFLWGLPHVYAWADDRKVRSDKVLIEKSQYLNTGWYVGRTLLYFAIVLTLTWLLNRMSLAQDRTADPDLARRMRIVSGPGLVAFCLLVTFAAVDWLMSVEPHWSSTMYGFYLIASQGLAALVFIIVMARYLSLREPLARYFSRKNFHDYGSLTFAILMLWTYFNFSQFLIIWSGNLPDEIFWYRHRTTGGWGWVALAVVLFHFAVPYALLLSRQRKRDSRRLVRVAVFLLGMRLVDLFWQVEPSYVDHHQPQLYWLYLAAPLCLGGLWLWWFVRELKRRPLLPVNDPRIAEVLVHD